MALTYGSFGVQPNQSVEWNDEEYRKNLQFIAAQWNRRQFNLASDASSNTPYTDDTRYVSNYIQQAQYFFGRQSFSDYGFLVKDELGNQTRFPLYRGMDITKILLHVNGVVRKMIQNLPKTINVTAYSKDAVSAKKELMNLIKMKAQEKTFFEIIDRKSTRLNSSHSQQSRMPSSA